MQSLLDENASAIFQARAVGEMIWLLIYDLRASFLIGILFDVPVIGRQTFRGYELDGVLNRSQENEHKGRLGRRKSLRKGQGPCGLQMKNKQPPYFECFAKTYFCGLSASASISQPLCFA